LLGQFIQRASSHLPDNDDRTNRGCHLQQSNGRLGEFMAAADLFNDHQYRGDGGCFLHRRRPNVSQWLLGDKLYDGNHRPVVNQQLYCGQRFSQQ
jgi:hypothetical protein